MKRKNLAWMLPALLLTGFTWKERLEEKLQLPNNIFLAKVEDYVDNQNNFGLIFNIDEKDLCRNYGNISKEERQKLVDKYINTIQESNKYFKLAKGNGETYYFYE